MKKRTKKGDLAKVVSLLKDILVEVRDLSLMLENDSGYATFAQSMKDAIEKIDALSAENALLRRSMPPSDSPHSLLT